ncbi:hypothetical protein PAP_05855 [Palaeococcus pacificus DY20341]|uniref:Uncharacterized protein n=1 Tax=Palaeococcus pacificus DY20341 TaxID=1343739 RepID=A0A075LTY4_9EURY|nr:hypothetical protein [Palaeococcus pacificus]AIF69571.1 hypothetical protein PAP_05855 [Palaeococcus pacificus DY20341]
MIAYEPLMVAMPLAKWLGEFVVKERRIPTGDEVREFFKSVGFEEVFLDKGMAVHRNRFILAITLPKKNTLVIDLLSSSGELSDALEVIAYHDKQIEGYIIDIIPANELEFEGNVGLEPAIIDDKNFELKSTPVLGYFEEEKEEISLVIDEEAYNLWKKSGKLEICPICGAEGLVWKESFAYCPSCGFGIRIRGEKK